MTTVFPVLDVSAYSYFPSVSVLAPSLVNNQIGADLKINFHLILTAAETTWQLPHHTLDSVHRFTQMYFVFSQRLKVKASPMQGIAYFHKNTEINIRRFVIYSMMGLYFSSKNLLVIMLCVHRISVSSCHGSDLCQYCQQLWVSFPFLLGILATETDRCSIMLGKYKGQGRVFFCQCSWMKILRVLYSSDLSQNTFAFSCILNTFREAAGIRTYVEEVLLPPVQ